jgi:hypothetical protein
MTIRPSKPLWRRVWAANAPAAPAPTTANRRWSGGSLRSWLFNGQGDQDALILNEDLVARQIIHRRRLSQSAGASAEGGLVPGANDLTRYRTPSDSGGTGMWTGGAVAATRASPVVLSFLAITVAPLAFLPQVGQCKF